jgi:hypothetical protein
LSCISAKSSLLHAVIQPNLAHYCTSSHTRQKTLVSLRHHMRLWPGYYTYYSRDMLCI